MGEYYIVYAKGQGNNHGKLVNKYRRTSSVRTRLIQTLTISVPSKAFSIQMTPVNTNSGKGEYILTVPGVRTNEVLYVLDNQVQG